MSSSIITTQSDSTKKIKAESLLFFSAKNGTHMLNNRTKIRRNSKQNFISFEKPMATRMWLSWYAVVGILEY